MQCSRRLEQKSGDACRRAAGGLASSSGLRRQSAACARAMRLVSTGRLYAMRTGEVMILRSWSRKLPVWLPPPALARYAHKPQKIRGLYIGRNNCSCDAGVVANGRWGRVVRLCYRKASTSAGASILCPMP